MEFLIAGLAHELLLPFVLARVTQPVVLPHEALAARVASEPGNETKRKTQQQMSMLAQVRKQKRQSYGFIERWAFM